MKQVIAGGIPVKKSVTCEFCGHLIPIEKAVKFDKNKYLCPVCSRKKSLQE